MVANAVAAVAVTGDLGRPEERAALFDVAPMEPVAWPRRTWTGRDRGTAAAATAAHGNLLDNGV